MEDMKGLCGRAFKVREVCADFEELLASEETASERMFLIKDQATVDGRR